MKKDITSKEFLFSFRGVGPFRKDRLGGGHCSVDFGLAARSHFGQNFLGRRVDGFEIVGTGHRLAIEVFFSLAGLDVRPGQ